MRFRLFSLFGIITVIAVALAALTSESAAVRTLATAILAINGLGILTGLIITYVLKFPRDGSYRHKMVGKNAMIQFETLEATEAFSRHAITQHGKKLSYEQIIEAWTNDPTFCSAFTMHLASSPFAAFRFETPAATSNTVSDPFEFVLLDAAFLCEASVDDKSFARHFTDEERDDGIVTFDNLGGDATLVVPSPRAEITAYGHLASFVRHAPAAQHDSFWRVIGETMQSKISDRPVWLSTHGGGVAWLHVRIDQRPKYYGYSRYRNA